MITEAIVRTSSPRSPLVPGLKQAVRRRLKRFAQERLQILVRLCHGHACRRFALAHRWLREDGILLDGAWFCSPGCFEAAALAAMTQSARGERHTMPRVPRMPFRLILLRDGLIAQDDLERAQAHAGHTGIPLAEALLALGCATGAQVAAALAAESGCAFYTLPPEALAPELLLPAALADRYGAATVHGAADRIVVGFVHRVDRGLLAMVERITGRRAEGCFFTAARRQAQLAQAALPSEAAGAEGQAPRVRPVSRPQAARTILDRALRTGAEQVRLARSGDLVWARLWTSDGAMEDCLVEISDEVSIEISGAANPLPASLPRQTSRSQEKKLRVL